jgi:hypothetical protein
LLLLQALPGPSSKFNDPARQQQQHLQDFLASLEASDEYKKPKKLLASLLSYYSSLQKVGGQWWVGLVHCTAACERWASHKVVPKQHTPTRQSMTHSHMSLAK